MQLFQVVFARGSSEIWTQVNGYTGLDGASMDMWRARYRRRPGRVFCAWKLRQAGLDVIVMDRAMFPHDKVCAGWITPQVLWIQAVTLTTSRTDLSAGTGFRAGCSVPVGK